MAPRPNTNWIADLNAAISAARKGREVLLHYFGRLEQVEEKFQAGIVSEADKESEKVIFSELKKTFPEAEFLGEESSVDGYSFRTPSEKGRWIIDPLDGTTNYVHRFPIFCISMGYEFQGQMQLAVIDVPLLGEVYTAIRGHGAFINGRPLKTSKTTQLKDSLLATGFFGQDEKQLAEQMPIFSQLVRQTRGVRRPGAAAYDLAMVARGVFDAFWERGIKPWDAAAGILLVEEAGGIVSTYRGEKYHPYKNSILASNGPLHNEILKIISPMAADQTD
jgi:myo-inositol-1(or 4)-monophosphatase